MLFLPKGIPLIQQLQKEHVVVQAFEDSLQARRSKPIKIGLLNLMPHKQETEYHFANILSSYPKDIQLVLLRLRTHEAKHTAKEYMNAFYHYWDEHIQDLDILISTGAPIEEIPFESVWYWKELQQCLDLLLVHKCSFVGICWSAQAALYHYYRIPKRNLAQKAFGVYPHHIVQEDKVLSQLSERVAFPVSRHSESVVSELNKEPNIKVLLSSDEVGVFLLKDAKRKHYFITGHPEYGSEVLKKEYERDIEKGRKDVQAPQNYSLTHPTCFWGHHTQILYHNIIDAMLTPEQ